jgi:hypothetical protein
VSGSRLSAGRPNQREPLRNDSPEGVTDEVEGIEAEVVCKGERIARHHLVVAQLRTRHGFVKGLD